MKKTVNLLSFIPKKTGVARSIQNMRPVLKILLFCHKKACLLAVAFVLFQTES